MIAASLPNEDFFLINLKLSSIPYDLKPANCLNNVLTPSVPLLTFADPGARV